MELLIIITMITTKIQTFNNENIKKEIQGDWVTTEGPLQIQLMNTSIGEEPLPFFTQEHKILVSTI